MRSCLQMQQDNPQEIPDSNEGKQFCISEYDTAALANSFLQYSTAEMEVDINDMIPNFYSVREVGSSYRAIDRIIVIGLKALISELDGQINPHFY